MHFYEFQVWAILLALNFFEVLDSTTTWFYMRLSGKPFSVVEKNSRMRKLGFKRSAILGLLVTIVATVIVLCLPSWVFQLSPFPEITVIVLLLFSYLAKFRVVIKNFRGIRKFINEKKDVS
jgi:hypothetical protein